MAFSNTLKRDTDSAFLKVLFLSVHGKLGIGMEGGFGALMVFVENAVYCSDVGER